ncbi:MAG: hypothetical protein HN457_08060 [Opitutales bacterium]|jgi:hypothetical protein|nr:hypothetical protein [Opitutales bacterium]MBT6381807.1 hypothetical protein [Opitutales bacterium]
MSIFFARDPGVADVLIPLYSTLTGNKFFYAKDKARELEASESATNGRKSGAVSQ